MGTGKSGFHLTWIECIIMKERTGHGMALYALGDMHLAFSVDKPMDRFGKVWKKHEEKIAKNCGEVIQREDTLVITGDHSWG